MSQPLVPTPELPGLIVFIRHAVAVDAEEYAGEDADRPLTRQGIKKATQAFRTLLKHYRPTRIISSPYARAATTAGLLAEATERLENGPPPKIEYTDALLPGASWELWSGLFQTLDPPCTEHDVLCVIGHEPSIGNIFCRHLGFRAAIPFKKAGIGIIAPQTLTQATLIAFAPAKLLRG